jgi:hypothetical protein
MKSLILSAFLVLASLCLVACGKKPAEPKAGAPAGHTHKAPHGGELVELGDHQFNLEILYDGSRGVLQAWVLDAHAENFVRVPIAGFEVEIEADGAKKTLEMLPVANPVTGELVGDTSLFEAKADFLMPAKHFDGVIKAIRVRDFDFQNVRFHVMMAGDRHSH